MYHVRSDENTGNLMTCSVYYKTTRRSKTALVRNTAKDRALRMYDGLLARYADKAGFVSAVVVNQETGGFIRKYRA